MAGNDAAGVKSFDPTLFFKETGSLNNWVQDRIARLYRQLVSCMGSQFNPDGRNREHRPALSFHKSFYNRLRI